MKNWQSFHKLLRESNAGSCLDFSNLAHHYYKQLLEKPLEVANMPERVIIVLDGQLANLPFDVFLKTPVKDGYCNYDLVNMDYVLKHHTLSYGYSANVLLENNNTIYEQKGSTPSFLGLAPTFEQINARYTNKFFPPLDSMEVINIAKLYKNSLLLMGDSAIDSLFRLHYQDYDIIHLSTHADQNGEDVRIYLTDSPLVGEALRGFSFNASLIVLSACETGLGELKQGEGIMSLARNLSIGGTPSVLMSLWSVPGNSTSDLMFHFHDHLKNGKGKDEALRLAKLDYLETSKEQKPFYWAAFVSIGNTDPLFSSRLSWWWAWPLLGIGLIFVFVEKRRKANESVG